MTSNRRLGRPQALLVTLVGLAFVLMTADVRSQGRGVISTLREGTRSLFEPIERTARGATRAATDFVDGLANLSSYKTENRELRERVAALEAKLEQAAGIEAENQELRELLSIAVPTYPTVAARVQLGGTSNFDGQVVIDKGSADGVLAGSPVINPEGLVGRVIEPVTDHSATVLLITDPGHAVKVKVRQSGDRGTVTGRGRGPLSLLITNAQASLAAGTVLVTDAGRYPADLVVGEVEVAAEPQAGFVLQTAVVPAVDFSRLDFVVVVQYTEPAGTADVPS